MRPLLSEIHPDYKPALDEEAVRVLVGWPRPAALYALGVLWSLDRVAGEPHPVSVARREEYEGLWVIEPWHGWRLPGWKAFDAPLALLLLYSKGKLRLYWGDDPDGPRRWTYRYQIDLETRVLTGKTLRGSVPLVTLTWTNWFYFVLKDTCAYF